MNCTICGTTFSISSKEVSLHKKFGFDPPAHCFECNQKHLISFRNGRTLYHRKCDATGQDIISIYAPEKPFKVYKAESWYSDTWDALDYGRPFDFSRPFFEQFRELQLAVPRLALLNMNGENSDYCNMTYGNKNSYLVFGGDFNEEVLFGTLCMRNRNSLDCDFSNESELAYEVSDVIECYRVQFAMDSKNCSDCAFISDCVGCSECILCTNLVKKSFHIRNKPYSKDEYFKQKALLLNGSSSQQQKNYREFLELRSARIVKYARLLSCENCTGGYIKNSRNCDNAYDVSDSEDLCNVIFASKSKDCFQSSLIGDNSELIYQLISCLNAINCSFSYFPLDTTNAMYSETVMNCQNIFGCIGLRRKEYCILNMQYSEVEYRATVKKIQEHLKKTGEWGKFFPKSFSCFGYNESTANDYFPLTKEQALKEGFTWRDEDNRDYKPQSITLTDSIDGMSENILNDTLSCLQCKKNYRIVSQELKFYKSEKLPIPRECPNCRHLRRMSVRNPRKLFKRFCEQCGVELLSTYSTERPEIVYCEGCYLKEVF